MHTLYELRDDQIQLILMALPLLEAQQEENANLSAGRDTKKAYQDLADGAHNLVALLLAMQERNTKLVSVGIDPNESKLYEARGSYVPQNVDIPRSLPLSPAELAAFSSAIAAIVRHMVANATKRPKMTTLVEEFAEAVLSARGKHEDPLTLELVQIASVCGNLLWQIETGVDVANLRTQQ